MLFYPKFASLVFCLLTLRVPVSPPDALHCVEDAIYQSVTKALTQMRTVPLIKTWEYHAKLKQSLSFDVDQLMG